MIKYELRSAPGSTITNPIESEEEVEPAARRNRSKCARASHVQSATSAAP